MKKIISTILLTLLVLSCKAQTNIMNITERCNHNPLATSNGTLYLKDINNLYIPYIGTWKWKEGNSEFILTLIKQTKYHYNQRSNNYFEDRIVGYYIYKENGIVVVASSSSTISLNSELPNVDYSLDCDADLMGSLRDIPKNKRYNSSLELLSPTQIRFTGEEDFHMGIQKEGYPALPHVYVGNTFPLDMVLVKQ